MKIVFTIAFLLQGSNWKVKSVRKESSTYTVVAKQKRPGGILYTVYQTQKIEPPKGEYKN